MIEAPLLLSRIRDAGGEVSVVAGRLRLAAPAPLPADLITAAQTHKAALMALLGYEEPADALGPTPTQRVASLAHLRPAQPTASAISTPPAGPDAAEVIDDYEASEQVRDHQREPLQSVSSRPADGRLSGAYVAEHPLVRAIRDAFPGASIERVCSADADLSDASQQPPSWWRAKAHHPTSGATCACCDGQRWWSTDERGWRCWTCHPPDHLPANAIKKVKT